jgi:hypothetical protein
MWTGWCFVSVSAYLCRFCSSTGVFLFRQAPGCTVLSTAMYDWSKQMDTDYKVRLENLLEERSAEEEFLRRLTLLNPVATILAISCQSSTCVPYCTSVTLATNQAMAAERPDQQIRSHTAPITIRASVRDHQSKSIKTSSRCVVTATRSASQVGSNTSSRTIGLSQRIPTALDPTPPSCKNPCPDSLHRSLGTGPLRMRANLLMSILSLISDVRFRRIRGQRRAGTL